ncbi:hypothetical protein GX831_03545 [bacterium]|nr:hypothetical protein [bacterium]
MKTVRNYLLKDNTLKQLLKGDNIFLVEKPEQINLDNYLIYKYKELTGGLIKDYQLEFNLVGKDLTKLLEIKERLIQLLDKPREQNYIKMVRQSKLLNGGGMLKNPNTDNYEIILFFLIKK